MTRSHAALVDLLDLTYEATTTAVGGLEGPGFDRPTRTELWSVQDLLFHQMCDAQRALVVLTTTDPGPADTDSVTYWSAWQPGAPGAAAHAGYATRAAAAYGQPSSLVAQWTETSRAAVRAARLRPAEDLVTTQGHVLLAADFVHTLVVEGVVHHVDLTLAVASPGLPGDAYALVLEVLTGLLGAPLPDPWAPVEAVLKGTGREPLSEADRELLGDQASRFPLFG